MWILPYIIVFRRSSFSNLNEDWGHFGNYLAGIGAILNVVIFIGITVFINNYNEKKREHEIITMEQQRAYELRASQKKELFIRFLSAFEKLALKTQELQLRIRNITFVGSSASNDNTKILNGYLQELAISLRSLSITAAAYIADQNDESRITSQIKSYLDNYLYDSINAIADGMINEHVIDKVNRTNNELSTVVNEISQIVKRYIWRDLK